VLDYVDRNQRKRGLASASLKSGSMAASGVRRAKAAHAKSSHWHILQAKFVQRVVSSRMPGL
jgi:hypothetical protein